ncbi:hypothetical protein [Peptostreptococcus sp.]|uniref:hypothetical protein n=1 Tax=Peptostreptococcus sp. TaxID=1262 RepID=UPI002FCA5645
MDSTILFGIVLFIIGFIFLAKSNNFFKAKDSKDKESWNGVPIPKTIISSFFIFIGLLIIVYRIYLNIH